MDDYRRLDRSRVCSNIRQVKPVRYYKSAIPANIRKVFVKPLAHFWSVHDQRSAFAHAPLLEMTSDSAPPPPRELPLPRIRSPWVAIIQYERPTKFGGNSPCSNCRRPWRNCGEDHAARLVLGHLQRQTYCWIDPPNLQVNQPANFVCRDIQDSGHYTFTPKGKL